MTEQTATATFEADASVIEADAVRLADHFAFDADAVAVLRRTAAHRAEQGEAVEAAVYARTAEIVAERAAAVRELVGPSPLEDARDRARAAGVTFGADARTSTPHLHDRALFLVRMDGVTVFARSFEVEALHSARVLAEHGRSVVFEVVAHF